MPTSDLQSYCLGPEDGLPDSAPRLINGVEIAQRFDRLAARLRDQSPEAVIALNFAIEEDGSVSDVRVEDTASREGSLAILELPDGTVLEAPRPTALPDVFRYEAESAFRIARFSPPTRLGKPVRLAANRLVIDIA